MIANRSTDCDIGGRLRRAREARGLSLHDLATRTRLSLAVLQAIEQNAFTRLPGGMYRKAYVRILAAEVGLDGHQIAADYGALYEPPIEPPAASNEDAARQEQWIRQLTPSPRRSLFTLAALAAPAAAWFILQPGPMRPAVIVDDSQQELVAASVPLGPALTFTAVRPFAAAPGMNAPEAPRVPLRIELAATGWCWVAADTDGERVLYRLLEPGERAVLEGRRVISLRLGDASSVRVSINDGAGRLLGGHGEVVQLEVTPDNVEGLREVAGETVSGD